MKGKNESDVRTLLGVDARELGTEEVRVWKRLALLDIFRGDKDIWDGNVCACQSSRRIGARGRCTNGPTSVRSGGDLQEMKSNSAP